MKNKALLKNTIWSLKIVARIGGIANAVFGLGWALYFFLWGWLPFWSALIAAPIAFIGSIPLMIFMVVVLGYLQKTPLSATTKINTVALLCAGCCACYGLAAAAMIGSTPFGSAGMTWVLSSLALIACALGGIYLSRKQLFNYFSQNHQIIKPIQQMETVQHEGNQPLTSSNNSHKILIKAIVTGVLILVMLIPTVFIENLVQERQVRQATVVAGVSDQWAQSQVLAGPYIYLPYKVFNIDKDKKVTEQINHLILLPEALNVNGTISHEIRRRSIYKVLLYRAALEDSGHFEFTIPKEIDSSLIQWKEVKICFGLSDFKGIEEMLVIHFNGVDYPMTPGLPTHNIDEKGLSASIPLELSDLGKKLSFHMNLKIKGSEQLHFLPLAGSSRFTIRSDWPSPSFDGSDLPSQRRVDDKGFTATWAFSKGNLPFSTVLNNYKLDKGRLSFGVTLVQPADGYAKTDRCIKYAILFIGLTFSLFFIIELLQKKPVHPVQYILVGLALTIFYTLLLSISEFINFDIAYLIAAVATIALISLYAFSHFKRAKTAALFGGVLTVLYGFIFVLIRLEDTALLIGSIGLFGILSLAMYASRKVNWYGNDTHI